MRPVGKQHLCKWSYEVHNWYKHAEHVNINCLHMCVMSCWICALGLVSTQVLACQTILVLIWSLWSWLSLGGLAYSNAFRHQQLYHGQLKKKRQSADIRLPSFRADSETVEKSVSIFVREIMMMLSSWGSQLKPFSTCRKLGSTSATHSFFSLKCDYNIMRKLFKTNKKILFPCGWTYKMLIRRICRFIFKRLKRFPWCFENLIMSPPVATTELRKR